MNAPYDPLVARDIVEFTLDGRKMQGYVDETIIEAAARHGIDIPHLCYKPGMRPDGNCRACMVEIKGERVLAPSCCRKPTPGMDLASRAALSAVVAELRDRGASIVIATHDDGLRAALADRVVDVAGGTVTERAPRQVHA